MTQIKRRHSGTPPRLAKLARANETTPVALLTTVLSDTLSYDEAAASLGVSTRTLRTWRQKYQIEVVR